MLQICSTDKEDPVSLPRDGACHGVSAVADGVSHDVDANVSEQTDEVVRPAPSCKIVATTGYSLQVEALCQWGDDLIRPLRGHRPGLPPALR